jgi:rsbT co-antagonist protein RsbR
MSTEKLEVAQLRSEVGALRQLIEVHERVSLEQAQQLEQALRDLEARNQALLEKERERLELIQRLRSAVDELSTPVLEVWDEVLTLPVVGVVDTERSAQMTERLLTEVVQTRCRFVIIDLTGVQLIDTSTADRIIKLARSVQLLGAECILTGIQPAVAQTLVELGVEFSQVNTQRNLKRALQLCMRSLQATAVPAPGRS